jgi:hypothetical protein
VRFTAGETADSFAQKLAVGVEYARAVLTLRSRERAELRGRFARPDFSGAQRAALQIRYGGAGERDCGLRRQFAALAERGPLGEPARAAWNATAARAIVDPAYAAERASELTDREERAFLALWGIPPDEYLHWRSEIVRACLQGRGAAFEALGAPPELDGPVLRAIWDFVKRRYGTF